MTGGTPPVGQLIDVLVRHLGPGGLFEEGTVATSVEAAGRLLAESVAEGFRTEHAALNLVDASGRIVHAVGVGAGPHPIEVVRQSGIRASDTALAYH